MSLLRRLEEQKQMEEHPEINEKDKPIVNSTVRSDPYQYLKTKIHKRIVAEMSLEDSKALVEKKADIKILREVVTRISNTVMDEEITLVPQAERRRIIPEVLAEVLGFGPIEPLLKDDTVTEIMVNNASQVYIERKGKLELTDVTFRDDGHVMHVIEKIIAPIGRRIDESSPMVDARLPDGSRVNAIIPPLALKGPALTIRKFAKEPYQVDDLIRFGTWTKEIADFLKACVEGKLNIIVSGGTGSGKTTTLNILSAFIPTTERIVTIEDAAELQLRQEHVVTLESRPANIEGKGQITMRDLVKNSLRMRPDRIIVGEVRGGEALDMLQAMNTGHDGSLTTGHANSPRDMLARLETMVLMAGMNLPDKAIREQIAAAMNLIVHESRFPDGTRKITALTEIQGMEGDIITLQDIFVYEQKGKDENGRVVGRFRPTGIRPKFMDKLMNSGIQVSNDIFWDKQRI
ncbi:MAG: CpaF family protein [Negativicutes bacterium]|nr:CpaF family protein [Negativicutes bacterium]